MDHVTQSNSAQTEELAATAQAFAEQAARLLQLVGTFKLAHGRESSRGDRGYEPSPQGDRRSTHLAITRATTVVPGKSASSAANGRKQLSHSHVLVGSSATRSDDASFEEV
jgi:methyl-accepting chemotaxis protein